MFRHSKLAAGLAIAATAVIGSAGGALADGVAAKARVRSPGGLERRLLRRGLRLPVVEHRCKEPGDGVLGSASDHDEWLVGGHIGVQHQWGLLVLGVEGGWQSTFVDRDGSSSACLRTVFRGARTLVYRQDAGCSARLNDITDHRWSGWLGGWSLDAVHHWWICERGVRFQRQNPCSVVGATNLVEQAHTRLGGWYLGGGFEWIVAPMWTAGLEYRHYDFDTGSTTAFRQDASLPAVALEPVSFDATTDTVMARVSWRWGREPAAAPLK